MSLFWFGSRVCVFELKCTRGGSVEDLGTTGAPAPFFLLIVESYPIHEQINVAVSVSVTMALTFPVSTPLGCDWRVD